MNENDFQNVLNENPTLTSFGFVDPQDPEFAEQREFLAQSYEPARRSAEWLSHYRVPIGFDSYTVKHCVEHEFAPCYVPEGATIAAALYLGFPRGKNRYLVFGKPGARIATTERHTWHPIQDCRSGLLALPKPNVGDVSLAGYPSDRFPGQQSGYVIGTAWGWKRIENRLVRLLVRIGKARIIEGILRLPQRPPVAKPGEFR